MPELRRPFHDQIAALHDEVGVMADDVVALVRASTDAFLEGDLDGAMAAAALDAAVDARYVAVERMAIEVFALQAPVARDLRVTVASLRIAQDLERSGDLAASIARRTSTVGPTTLTAPIRLLVHEMAAESFRMLGAAARSYAVFDADLARQVVAWDEDMDRLYATLLEAMFDVPSTDRRELVELAFVARFLERLGDHAVVIAERTCFIVGETYSAGDQDETPP